MYKFSQERYCKALLNMGVVRIGTLHDFRRDEHKQGIADRLEGTKEVSHSFENYTVGAAGDPRAEPLQQFGVRVENCIGSTFNVTRVFESPDCFIFCMAENCSNETMRQFEGVDACVRIDNVRGFISLLTQALASHRPVAFKGIHRVTYQPRSEPWNGRNWGAHPALIKDPGFEKQSELRAIWKSLDGKPLQPIVLGDYRLGRFCSEVKVFDRVPKRWLRTSSNRAA